MFYKGIKINFKTSIAAVKSNFPKSTIANLLNDMPKSSDQYSLHTLLAIFYSKYNCECELKKLDVLQSSSQSSPEVQNHLKTINILLKLLDCFNKLNNMFFSRSLTNDQIQGLLPNIRKFFSNFSCLNNLLGNFELFVKLIDISMKFSRSPLGIFIDIVIAYLISFLVKYYRIKDITDFENFVALIKNKKLFNVLSPHVYLMACQFV